MVEILEGSNTFSSGAMDTCDPDRRGLGYVFYHSMTKYKNCTAQVSYSELF